MAQKTQVFFFLYFAMTGMHALHMIIGIGLLVLAYVSGRIEGSSQRGMSRRLKISGCIGTSSILCGCSCFRCSTSSTGIPFKSRAPPFDTGWKEKSMSEYHDPSNVVNPEHADHHIVTPVTYAMVFGALLIGTGITVVRGIGRSGNLQSDYCAGDRLHQGGDRDPVLHAREVSVEAGEVDGHLRVSLRFSC